MYMETLNNILTDLSGLLWGWPMIVLLLGTHIFLTIRLRFPQRHIWTAIKLSVSRDSDSSGDVSQFGASEWAWGLSRLIDGLQQLGPAHTKIDTEHIGVTGCSYAGKMALFCGAFDERVALTIAQEPLRGALMGFRSELRPDASRDIRSS